MSLSTMTTGELIANLVGGASRIYPESGLKRIKDKAKFFLRGIAMPGLSSQWFDLLKRPEMAVAVRNNPRLLSKLQRPYLHRNLDAARRLNVLREHYGFLKSRISAENVETIYSATGLLLMDFSLEEVGKLSVRLFYRDVFEKEGELTLALCNESGEGVIFAASFTVISYSQTPSVLFVGGLQSFKENTRESVVAITRGMHGLRPKGFLLFAIQRLAQIWGIQKIRAVSNDMSVFQDFRLKKKKVYADYDEFWIESGGKLDADGLFTLPSKFVLRPMTDIKPNKRGIYKKRYAMLDEMAVKIVVRLESIQTLPP